MDTGNTSNTRESWEENRVWPAAHQVGCTGTGLFQWSKELIIQPSCQPRRQAAQRLLFRLMMPPVSAVEGQWVGTPSLQWSGGNWPCQTIYKRIKRRGPWPTILWEFYTAENIHEVWIDQVKGKDCLEGTRLKPYINHRTLLGNTLSANFPERDLPNSLHTHWFACA